MKATTHLTSVMGTIKLGHDLTKFIFEIQSSVCVCFEQGAWNFVQ
jgi:hypothetical protein